MNDLATERPIVAPASHQDNILIQACGQPLQPLEIGKRLMYLPPTPEQVGPVSLEYLDHYAADIFRMYIPTAEGIRLAQTLHLMMIQGYVHRNPLSPSTWRRIYSGTGQDAAVNPIQMGATVTGVSGAGKSTAIERALSLFPQVVEHAVMPNLARPSPQLLWLKVEVPASGKIADLVENLAIATDDVLGTNHATELFAGRKMKGAALMHQWRQRVSCNFLGLLVLDEIQNLFKIETKSNRQAAARSRSAERPALRIVDDEALKALLTLSNLSKVPVVYCGTPDGMEALNTRMSTAQRMLTAGAHVIQHASGPDDSFYSKRLFPSLCRYQWLPRQLPASDELRQLLYRLSAGIPRILLMTWFHANRRAIQRKADCLSLDDFLCVSESVLAPLRPAVEAIQSGDPRLMRMYEDLLEPIRR